MKYLLKSITVLFLMASFNTTSLAQNQITTNVGHSIKVGFPMFLFASSNKAIHLGYNPHIEISNRFATEAQFSYSGAKFKQNDDLFSHNGGHLHVINALGGARFYLIKKEEKAQLYFNILLGYAFVNDQELTNDGDINSFRNSKDHALGYSSGIYLNTKHNFNFGIAFETNAATTLKVGYQF